MKLSDIRMGKRYRQDLGDIETLARSMADVGLIQPIIVKPDNILVAGARRIRAADSLGWIEITHVVARNLEEELQLLKAQRDENTCRKDFAPSEAVAIGRDMGEREAAEAKKRQGARTDLEHGAQLAQSEMGKTRDKIAESVGMGHSTYQKAEKIIEAAEENPGLFSDLPDKMDEKSVDAAYKELRRRELAAERSAIAKAAQDLPADDHWTVEAADIRSYQTNQRFDFIITDPPYPREYLDLYAVLARRALEWLNPSGLLVAMCGQSYLDQIMQMMGEHLEYYWTGCYLTPGQPKPLRHRQVNTSWKPILIYRLPCATYKGKLFGDVWTSEGNDKEHHKWGQSISGMLALIKQICLPGQTIFDPFCGAGTTGVAALMHGCLFNGIDLDEDNVGITRKRLHDTTQI
uniref:Putative methyltransferase n=1 Tax=viral metagenome TaxID=1070528 RepID=A0A6H1ZD78_9ZZZZ